MVMAMCYGIRGWNSFGLVVIYVYVCIYVYFIVSSPYLCVFGDDCVRGTRKHILLQVNLVRLSHRAGARSGGSFTIVLYFMIYNKL